MFFKDIWNKVADGATNAAGYIRDRLREMQDALWDRLGHVGQTMWDAARSVSNDLWQRLGDLGQTVWNGFVDVGNKLWAVIAAAAGVVRDAIATASSQLWQRLGDLGQTVWNGFVDVGDKLWAVIASAAAAIRDVIIAVGAGLRDALTNGFGRVTDSVDATAGKLDDVGATLKDAPSAAAEKLVEAMFGAGDAASDFFEGQHALFSAFLLGNVDSVDDVLGLLLGKKKLPGPLWDIITMPVYAAALLAALQAMGGVAAEGVVQDFRRRNPKALFDPQDLRDAFLRGKVTEADARDQLQSVGYSETRARVLMDLWRDIPPPADLIRMAVREAFSPEVVAKFGQDQDFPPRFGELAEQLGISTEFSAAYWAAHWDLPSPQQGFEMFHRGVIDAETLQVLLRALDVMPFWRGKLTDIAYNVVGRIDTRRLFQSGVWDRARVEKSYLDQGFPPAEAHDLTEWTVLEFGDNAQGSRDLTRANIEKAFKQGRLARSEAIFALVELGYTEDEADFLIANVEVDVWNAASDAAANSVREITQSTVLTAYRNRVLPRGEAESMLAALGYTADGIDLLIAVQDFANENELAQLRAKVIEQEFRQGGIGGDEARARLAGAGLGIDRADLIVQRWEIQYGAKDRDLTESQLRNALEKGFIDDVTYVLRIIALGYSQGDAAILLRLAGGADTPALRQLTSAQIVDAYKRTLTSRATAMERLIVLGFAGADAELQLKAADQDLARVAATKAQRETDAAAAAVKDLARTSIEGAYKRGIIDRAGAKARLVALGFAAADAELLLQVVDSDLAKAAVK